MSPFSLPNFVAGVTPPEAQADSDLPAYWPLRHRVLERAVGSVSGSRKELISHVETAIGQRLQQEAKKHQFSVSFPRLEFCTDNGAMIAYAGACRLQAGQREDLEVQVHPRWSLEALPAL